jgi:hypothetical protein
MQDLFDLGKDYSWYTALVLHASPNCFTFVIPIRLLLNPTYYVYISLLKKLLRLIAVHNFHSIQFLFF